MKGKKIKADLEEELQLYHHQVDEEALKRQVTHTKLAIDDRIDELELKKMSAQPRNQWKSILKVAAALVIVSAVSILIFNRRHLLKTGTATYTTIQTNAQQRKKVVLADSSVVWLNAHSKLSFNNDFDQERREVLLEGEAFFEVKHQKDKPFIVKAGVLRTQVLGTKFNIEAYPHQDSIAVALLSGKIAVSVGGQKAVLLPNQSISFDQRHQVLSRVRERNVAQDIAWHQGELLFINTPFKAVLAKLESNFDIKITLKSEELALVKINGKFGLQENPVTIIEELCRLIDARYKKQEGLITISKVNQ